MNIEKNLKILKLVNFEVDIKKITRSKRNVINTFMENES